MRERSPESLSRIMINWLNQLILTTFLKCEHLHVKLRFSPGKDMDGDNGMYLISFTTFRLFFSMHRHRFFALWPSSVIKTPNGTEWNLNIEGSIVQFSLSGRVVKSVITVFEIVVVSSSLILSDVWVTVSANSVTKVVTGIGVVVASRIPNWYALKWTWLLLSYLLTNS